MTSSRKRFNPTFLVLSALCVLLGGGLGFSRALLASDGALPGSTALKVQCDPQDDPLSCDDHTERVFADINGDGSVDAHDFVLLVADMGSRGPIAADINHDGEVDSRDLAALIRRLNS
jgi:hypothetical protein